MLDRSKMPEIGQINQIKIPTWKSYTLDNGIPVAYYNAGTQDVIKLEVVFFAGRPYEEKALVALATTNQLKEQTTNYSGLDIAEYFDYRGSRLYFPFNLDTSNLVVTSLRKHFEGLVPMVIDMLMHPTFPQEELDAFAERNQQRLALELTKSEVVAYRTITEEIFGSKHPYGYNSLPESYGKLERRDLVCHFEQNYITPQCMIFLSGKVGENELNVLNSAFNQLRGGAARQPRLGSVPKAQRKTIWIDMENNVQTAIRIGRKLFDRQHPDYHGLYVLNTVLGGYFGSRLMTNLREDKGYTYNIYSTMDMMCHDGYFYIGTEVGNEYIEPTLKEIYKELSRLQEELIRPDELAMVKNYLMGYFLTLIDGPFNVAELIMTLQVDGLKPSFLEEMLVSFQDISAQKLRDLAQKYLGQEELMEVVVGL